MPLSGMPCGHEKLHSIVDIAVRDEIDVLESDEILVLVGEPGHHWGDQVDLNVFEPEGLDHRAAPPCVEPTGDHLSLVGRRGRCQNERIWEPHSAELDGQVHPLLERRLTH